MRRESIDWELMSIASRLTFRTCDISDEVQSGALQSVPTGLNYLLNLYRFHINAIHPQVKLTINLNQPSNAFKCLVNGYDILLK